GLRFLDRLQREQLRLSERRRSRRHRLSLRLGRRFLASRHREQKAGKDAHHKRCSCYFRAVCCGDLTSENSRKKSTIPSVSSRPVSPSKRKSTDSSQMPPQLSHIS